MALWSDGRERSKNYRGSSLDKAIIRYFEEHREEEALALLWDNEYMRAEVKRRRAFEVAHPKVMAAKA